MNRYARQTLFRPIGQTGQVKLGQARVAVIGLGALGTVIATQLVRAGVGFLRLVDRDIIEPSNLQRQSLYDEQDAQVGRAKAEAAAEKLRFANSEVELECVIEDVDWRNAERLMSDVDVILDGTDNFQIRYLINDVAVKHGKAWAYGGAVSSYGSTAFFRPGVTPCFVCLFGESSGHGGHDTCDTVGVISPIVSMIASHQVAETLKYLTGNSDALANAIVNIDVWSNTYQSMKLPQPSPDCPCCQGWQFTSLNTHVDSLTVSLCGRQTIQVRPQMKLTVSLQDMAHRLSSFGSVRHNANLLRCDFGDVQFTLFADGRALFHGTEDETVARSMYARYVGM